MLDPVTMNLGTRMSHDKSSPKQKLQICKQQQTTSGNAMSFVPITILPFLLIFLRALCFHVYNRCECGKKGKETSK